MSKFENSNQISKNNSNINHKSQIQPKLKFGEYILTPLESFIINKQMPHGFKLELEENLIKVTDSINNNEIKKNKKNKISRKSPVYQNNQINHKNIKKNGNQSIKKRINKDLSINIENSATNINREKYKITKKCKIGMERIKSYPLANNFYIFNNPEMPSLSKVEKKVNNYEYESFYDFEMDIRKIWNYFFYVGEKGNKDIYEKTSKICEKWENICSELENYNVDMHESISNTVLRRAEKNRKEIQEYNENNIKKEKNDINIVIEKEKDKEINGVNNIKEPMTREEKNVLGFLIRNNLNMNQLKGIAKLVMGKDDVKVLEFDIDKLTNEELRKLETYVNQCVEENKSNNSSNKKNNNNKNIDNNIINNKGKENEINNKSVNNEENKEKINEKNNEIKNKINNIEEKGIKSENNQNKNKSNFPLSDSDSLSSDSSLSD